MKYLLSLTLLVIGIFAFSSGQLTPAFIVNHDKAAHALTFFILSWMLRRSFPAMPWLKIIMLLSLVALAIETIQFLFAERGFSIEDMLFNAMGIFSYFILIQVLQLTGLLRLSAQEKNR
ncbi:VanZ family protein [Methyloprofundus sp.]|uniref:VanZ family protein n=1 Tax=Methyloprofundus sp. TaxID=2020875 RepID=UPI003D11E73A